MKEQYADYSRAVGKICPTHKKTAMYTKELPSINHWKCHARQHDFERLSLHFGKLLYQSVGPLCQTLTKNSIKMDWASMIRLSLNHRFCRFISDQYCFAWNYACITNRNWRKWKHEISRSARSVRTSGHQYPRYTNRIWPLLKVSCRRMKRVECTGSI